MNKGLEEQIQFADDIRYCYDALEGIDCIYHSFDEVRCFMRLSKALIDLGYHKTEVKTNSDKFRSMSDEELADLCIAVCWDGFAEESFCVSMMTHNVYGTHKEAYNANLEYLRQEYKGE